MPDKSEKDRLKQVSPQPETFWQRMTSGNPLSQDTANAWPELAKSWAGRGIEMPNETAATRSVRPMNMIERTINPGAAGVTWPWGTVALNRDEIQNSGLNLDDTLVHELTHVGQNQKQNFLGLLARNLKQMPQGYMDKPTEKEAFSAEHSRPVRRFDIDLDQEARKRAIMNRGK